MGIKKELITYINNDPSLGIKINWKKWRKNFKTLNVPSWTWDITQLPMHSGMYQVGYSGRAATKTTNVLLGGMVLNQMYGIKIAYVRQIEEMIAPKATKDLFSTISDPQYHYIDTLTDGRYNSVCYKSRRWYYCITDDEGKITEVAPEHFMFMASVDKQQNIKSGSSFSNMDWIIYDEFINKVYMPDEIVDFLNLQSTICRLRQSPVIWMLANTTDIEANWWYELGIDEVVKTLDAGGERDVKTDKGTQIHVSYISTQNQRKSVREKVNQLFYGFQNKKLASVTGEDWSIKPRQHIPKHASEQILHVIVPNLFIMSHGKYVELEIVQHEELGVCCFCHRCNEPTREDDIILTTDFRTDPRYYYGFGPAKLNLLLSKLVRDNRFYYSGESVGAFVGSYFNSIPPTI